MTVTVTDEDGVRRLRLDRPERRNSFTGEMVAALHAGLAAGLDDPACRCIVIDGAGDHFCAGRDLNAFGKAPAPEQIRAGDDLWAELFRRLDEADTPSVALVRGYAYAGGFTLAMGCDFVLADRSARFQVSEMRHGFPAAINTPVLSKLLGPRLTLELAVLGETVAADRLYAMGLLNRLVDDQAALETEAAEFITTILARDPAAIGQTQRLNRAVRDGGLSNALNMGSLINSQVALTGGFAAAGKNLARGKT